MYLHYVFQNNERLFSYTALFTKEKKKKAVAGDTPLRLPFLPRYSVNDNFVCRLFKKISAVYFTKFARRREIH